MMSDKHDSSAIVIGAGIGGLSAALRLAAHGYSVTVFEQNSAVGGKIRQVSSAVGPIDTGPTVVTMLDIFENLFAETGADLHDYVQLGSNLMIARHFWSDGMQFDLFRDVDRNAAEIENTFGPKSAQQYRHFERQTLAMYRAFDAPVMRSGKINLFSAGKAVLSNPSIWPVMLKRNLDSYLRSCFSEPRLRQLFGRYATYVGGSPNSSQGGDRVGF
ncbi:MAG: FAD-dependent oxidoreductase [Pseudomonadota bacterium]